MQYGVARKRCVAREVKYAVVRVPTPQIDILRSYCLGDLSLKFVCVIQRLPEQVMRMIDA